MNRVPYRATILVADDDAVIRSNLALMAQIGGIRRARSGRRRRSRAALLDPTVALALLDLKMPVQDGMTVFARTPTVWTKRRLSS